jgi:dTDP-4-dehydrorhamnose 3,5-epimerase-like enzyme
MTLESKGERGDKRGKIFFFTNNETKVNLFEVKKGFARGGHYHNYDIVHVLIDGKIEHRVEDMMTKREEISILTAPAIMKIPAKSANLIIALEDSIFTEVFIGEYKSTVYEKYRDIVMQKMNI